MRKVFLFVSFIIAFNASSFAQRQIGFLIPGSMYEGKAGFICLQHHGGSFPKMGDDFITEGSAIKVKRAADSWEFSDGNQLNKPTLIGEAKDIQSGEKSFGSIDKGLQKLAEDEIHEATQNGLTKMSTKRKWQIQDLVWQYEDFVNEGIIEKNCQQPRETMLNRLNTVLETDYTIEDLANTESDIWRKIYSISDVNLATEYRNSEPRLPYKIVGNEIQITNTDNRVETIHIKVMPNGSINEAFINKYINNIENELWDYEYGSEKVLDFTRGGNHPTLKVINKSTQKQKRCIILYNGVTILTKISLKNYC